jgi:hypothetical protein
VHLLSSLLAVPAAADAVALGAWTADGARLELREEEGKVVGRIAVSGGGVAPRCGAEDDTALAVLPRELVEKDPDFSCLRGERQWAEILDQMSAESKPRP